MWRCLGSVASWDHDPDRHAATFRPLDGGLRPAALPLRLRPQGWRVHLRHGPFLGHHHLAEWPSAPTQGTIWQLPAARSQAPTSDGPTGFASIIRARVLPAPRWFLVGETCGGCFWFVSHAAGRPDGPLPRAEGHGGCRRCVGGRLSAAPGAMKQRHPAMVRPPERKPLPFRLAVHDADRQPGWYAHGLCASEVPRRNTSATTLCARPSASLRLCVRPRDAPTLRGDTRLPPRSWRIGVLAWVPPAVGCFMIGCSLPAWSPACVRCS